MTQNGAVHQFHTSAAAAACDPVRANLDHRVHFCTLLDFLLFWFAVKANAAEGERRVSYFDCIDSVQHELFLKVFIVSLHYPVMGARGAVNSFTAVDYGRYLSLNWTGLTKDQSPHIYNSLSASLLLSVPPTPSILHSLIACFIKMN